MRPAPFKDHFSQHAGEYAKYRPHYPAALFEYLAGLAPAREAAWDCATGNGQAALGLAPYFDRIIGTDASAPQITQATPHPKVQYAVVPAERTAMPARSLDLIAVAQALHWFHFNEFYAEARRVLKPRGVIAVWCYNLLRCEPGIDALLDEYYVNVVGRFWPPERKLLEDRYQNISFPFAEIAAPNFFMEAEWPLDDLLGYLRTWSATQIFIAQNQADPLVDFRRRLLAHWDNPALSKRMQWPLYVRVGRMTAN